MKQNITTQFNTTPHKKTQKRKIRYMTQSEKPRQDGRRKEHYDTIQYYTIEQKEKRRVRYTKENKTLEQNTKWKKNSTTQYKTILQNKKQ